MFSTLRKLYWYTSAYLRKHFGKIASATAFGVILFAFLLPLLTRIPQVKPTTHIGIIGGYNFATLPINIQRQISRGLTTVAEDGSAVPDIAERWSVEDEGKTYRFILKKDVRWQDGTLIKPDDISFNFQDTQIVATDNEIVFKLKEPFAPFPIVVSQPLFKEVKLPYLRFFQRKRIIALGEYSVRKVTYADTIISELILDSPTDRIIYRFYLTEERAKTAFKRGNVDRILDLGSPEELATWPNVTITPQIHFDQYLGVFFNQNDPLFTKNIRQALAYATEKPTTIERAKSPMNLNSWAYLDGVKSYAYDLERGVERVLDGIPASPLTINLTTSSRFEAEAESIKGQWQLLGEKAYATCMTKSDIKDKNECEKVKITVNVLITNFPDTNNYQALLIGQSIPNDPDQYGLWHSTQNTNFTFYKSPRVDVLLENGRKTTDLTERKALYQEFQQFLVEDSPALFLRYLTSYNVQRI